MGHEVSGFTKLMAVIRNLALRPDWSYIFLMTRFAIILVLGLAAAPVAAQQNDVEEGFDLLGEGMQLLLRGLMSEMEPALRDLQGALQSIDGYHAPEILPNGDILIRKKQPEELTDPVDPPGPGEIDI